MMHLADWIVSFVAGPLLVLFTVAIGSAVLRLRTIAIRVDRIEKELEPLVTMPQRFEQLNERCMMRCDADKEFRLRNDKAHDRIEIRQGKTDEKFEEARMERRQEMKDLKNDLIREFRKANGE